MSTTTRPKQSAPAKRTEQAAPASTPAGFRGSFPLLPAAAATAVCLGTPGPWGSEGWHEPGAELERKAFPTTTRGWHPGEGRVVSAPERRTAECRGCRNWRQGRAERAAEAARLRGYKAALLAERKAVKAAKAAERRAAAKVAAA